MACCDAPDPALLEKNNRMFCRNCRRYLDQQVQAKEERDDEPEAGDPGRGDEPGDG